VRVKLRLLTAFVPLILSWISAAPSWTQTAPTQEPKSDARGQIEYENGQYGFCFALPQSWKGYTIVTLHWDGSSEDRGPELSGPLLLIRHPAWTKEDPREDIPIMIFISKDWPRVANGEVVVSAAPFAPNELGRNRHYVFALPPRWDFDELPGVEEVEALVSNKSLKATCGDHLASASASASPGR
jgi:hypothetical protein